MAEQYALAAARVAVAQLAEEAGFDALHQSSAQIMSELMLRYIEEAGTGAHSYSEHAGRVEPNPLDVVSVGATWPPACPVTVSTAGSG